MEFTRKQAALIVQTLVKLSDEAADRHEEKHGPTPRYPIMYGTILSNIEFFLSDPEFWIKTWNIKL